MKNKILAISGSTKANSTNETLLKMMGEMVKDKYEMNIYPIGSLPFFNPDIDRDGAPEVVLDFRRQIEMADAVIICTPEYVFSLPGVLKNALEWTVSSSSFSGKKTALIVASASGEKAFESLQLIMKTIEAKIDDKTSLLIQGAKGKVDANDTHTKEKLESLMTELLTNLK
jgi:NAD(P)H-dependent FMN reductase